MGIPVLSPEENNSKAVQRKDTQGRTQAPKQTGSVVASILVLVS